MEKTKKIILIIAIIGFACVMIYFVSVVIKTIAEYNSNKKELELGKKLIIEIWVCKKNNNNKLSTKTLTINNEHEFTFECVEEENNQLKLKYIISGKCYLGNFKDENKTYKFDRKNYENIVNAPEQEYNWKEYKYYEAPTATMKNDILELYGEQYINLVQV